MPSPSRPNIVRERDRTRLPHTIPGVRRPGRDASSPSARRSSTSGRGSPSRELADAVERRRARADRERASSPATASRSGRRTPPSGSIAALGVYRAGGVDRAAQHPVQGRRGARTSSTAPTRKLLFTVTDFLDTNYVELLRGGRAGAVARRRSSCCAAAARGHGRWDRLPRARRERRRPATIAAREAALTGDDLSDILFTSGTTGRPKGAMLTHGASVRAYDAWSTVVGLRARRPLPRRQPVLPLVRPEGRHPRVPRSRARRSSRTRCSTSTR